MASLAGKVISITGAAGGMGKAVAKLAASRGAKLAIADVQKDRLQDIESDLQSSGSEVKASIVDVRSHAEVNDWINGTFKHFGRLDCSANMAGILGGEQKFEDTSNELWDRVLGVNLIGTMNCVRAQLKVMEKGASIVNVSSVLGTTGMPGQSIYSISKHGVAALTKNVAKEVGSRGIRVNAIAPGVIDTPMSRKADGSLYLSEEQFAMFCPIPRYGQPEEIAKLVAFLFSEESSYMHGHLTYIDGGMAC